MSVLDLGENGKKQLRSMGYRVKRFSVLLDKLFGETDRDSEFWKKKIEEIKRVNPNHPRIKTYEQQLQYALEEEGKTNAKKAEEAARRRAQGHSSGYNTKSTYNAAGEAEARARAYEKAMKNRWEAARSSINSAARREGNIGFNKMARESAKIDAIGLAAIPAAYGVYAFHDARKKKKAWEKKKQKQKEFSREETKEEKRKRLKSSGILLGTSAALGSGVGALSTLTTGEKIKGKVADQNLFESSAKVNYMNRNLFINPPSVDEEISKDLGHSAEAYERYKKRAGKVIRKATKKNAVKGALIGTAIGLPFAYSNSVHQKILNEKKKKTKKFSSVLMPGFKLVPVEDLSDKQLENVAKYDSPRSIKISKKNQKKTDLMLGAASGVTGLYAGKDISKIHGKRLAPGMMKGALIGTAAGVGVSEALGYFGRKHHRKNAEEARVELEKRKK
jgi:hypothetical protein